MVLEVIAEKHNVDLLSKVSRYFADKLNNAILHAAIRNECCVTLEHETAIKNWLPDSEFQEMLDLLDGNGIHIERSGNLTRVWFSVQEVGQAAIEDIVS